MQIEKNENDTEEDLNDVLTGARIIENSMI
jgi:hypothetical protein